jgi:hypothetical protein
MILATALLLAALFSLPLLARPRRSRGGVDLLAPARVTAVFHLVTIVPYLILVSIDESVMKPMIRQGSTDVAPAIVWYGVVQALAFVALLVGIRSRRAAAIAAHLPVIATQFRPARYRPAVLCALLVAGLGFAFFLAQIGGLSALLMNMERRTELTAGAGYLLALLNLLFFAVVILIYSLRRWPSRAKWLAIGGLVVVAGAVFSSLGGRKATILIFVAALFAWHYGVRPIRRLRLRHLSIALILVPYFVLMPIVRSPGGFAYFASRPDELAGEALRNIQTAIVDLSYVDTYVFVTNDFRPSDIWWGRSYLDLLKAPVPSSVDTAKPPLDDGVYVRTLAEGLRAEPGMAFRDLFYSSWPPETLGITYMNFWLPGVVIGMYLLGAVYRLAYAYMIRSRCTLYSILVYAHIVVSFHLSNLRIVQAVVYLTMTTVFFGLFFGFRRAKLPPRRVLVVRRGARRGRAVGLAPALAEQAG